MPPRSAAQGRRKGDLAGIADPCVGPGGGDPFDWSYPVGLARRGRG